jgi:hypothetical protein
MRRVVVCGRFGAATINETTFYVTQVQAAGLRNASAFARIEPVPGVGRSETLVITSSSSAMASSVRPGTSGNRHATLGRRAGWERRAHRSVCARGSRY